MSNVSTSTIEMVNKVLEEASPAFEQHQAELIKELQDEANKFLSKYEEALDVIKLLQAKTITAGQYRQAIQHQKTNPPYSSQMIEAYIKVKNEIGSEKLLQNDVVKNFLHEALYFNDTVLKILGDKAAINLTFVFLSTDQHGNIEPIVLSAPAEIILREGSGVNIVADLESHSRNLKGRFQYNFEQMKEAFKDIIERDKSIFVSEEGMGELQKLNQAYLKALDLYGKFNPFIFWRLQNQKTWNEIFIGGAAGDISEAYAFFFYQRSKEKSVQDFFPSNDRLHNKNLQTFIIEGIAQVDSVSGLYATDVETQKYGYAVKALDASLPGISQMIKLARQIASKGNTYSIQKLRDLAEKKKYKTKDGKFLTDEAGEKIGKGKRNIVGKFLGKGESLSENNFQGVLKSALYTKSGKARSRAGSLLSMDLTLQKVNISENFDSGI